MLTPLKCILANVYYPETYGQEMSYYETLRVLIDKVNAVIEQINTLEDDILAKVDARLAEYDRRFNSVVNELNARMDNINEQINSLQTSVQSLNASVATLNGQVTAINLQIQNINSQLDALRLANTELRNYVDAQNAETRADIENRYNRLVGYIDALTDIVNNNFNTLQADINLARAQATAYTDLKYAELDEKVDNALIGATMVYSPYTGMLVTVQQAINEVATQGINSYTVGEYDALAVTAGTYDGKNIMAYSFDFNSKAVLP